MIPGALFSHESHHGGFTLLCKLAMWSARGQTLERRQLSQHTQAYAPIPFFVSAKIIFKREIKDSFNVISIGLEYSLLVF